MRMGIALLENEWRHQTNDSVLEADGTVSIQPGL
jgi:hypothetical protein